ncbi:glycosyltransferase [Pseudochrobactrum kiredjianiae]|uniref:Glycosyltransferase n=1 Tax=Pseudochrobactrum kiredjianiae TaxID=386305 RepID=A0ABW3V4M7_9HYPH|nr:glycosyltransferase [Pseudochrobactrum kiredjianiae]MDM7851883.1 glycosyltransferase [Pseudochrobactrum kiredjianiae]
MINNILQNVVLPASEHADRVSLYCRWPSGNIALANAKGELNLTAGSVVDFTTFFNAFSHRKWHEATGIEHVCLHVCGRGAVRVLISSYSATAAAIRVSEYEGELNASGIEVSVPSLSQISGEMLSFLVIALENSVIESVTWVTSENAKRDIRLAAVITTFQRETEIFAAMEKFSSKIIPRYKNSIHLFVVDNGSTLNVENTEYLTIVSNKNLGGAGGFTRGFIEVKKRQGYTHVLFMDDDASCEPESVWRAKTFLAYLNDERASVAGAMLYTDMPSIQYEKGALMRLNGSGKAVWHAEHSGWDLSDIACVAANDLPGNLNYGGWWFFAFPINAVKHLPFPFFVRGDDVDFSLSNKLPIVTLNGIATWCENFGYKLNPPTEYLASRSWMALSFMHADSGANKATFNLLLRNAYKMGMRFDYAGMHAVLDGVEHALLGPQFFADKPSPIDVLTNQKKRNKLVKLTSDQFKYLVPISWRKKRQKRLVLVLSVGGAFLPQRMVQSVIMHAKIAWEAGTWTLIRVGAVAFGVGSEVYVYKRDSKELRSGLKRILKLKIQYLRQRRVVKLNYQNNSAKYKTREYWENVLDVRSDDK